MSKELKIAHQADEIPMTNNIVLDIKFFLQRNYDLKKNIVSRNIELDGVPINDDVINSIFIRIKTNYLRASHALVKTIIFSDFVPKYNPFIDIYEANKNIKTDNELERLCRTIDTDTQCFHTWITKWYISIIASIHGDHSPLALVLTGGINVGKTEWFRRLLPKELHQFHSEEKMTADKDAQILMTKKIIILDDEWGGLTKKEEKFFRAMMSKQTFSIREPFGHVSVDLTRLSVFCGTCNEVEIINDADNNRRILPIDVRKINFDAYNKIDKTALFIEAWRRYLDGESYKLTANEIAILYNSSEKHKIIDAEEELLNSKFDKPNPDEDVTRDPFSLKRWTTSEILANLRATTGMVLTPRKLGLALKSSGFEQVIEKRNGKTTRLYLLYLK